MTRTFVYLHRAMLLVLTLISTQSAAHLLFAGKLFGYACMAVVSVAMANMLFVALDTKVKP